MGAKGQTVSNTNQNQTYSPTGSNYLTSALNQGQAASQLPFNIPQAPVAGFSQDQLSAFQNVNNAQGSAQPYFNQAQSLYGQAAQQPNVANFYNPMASAVTAQMQNIFGEQNAQNTGSLTQAAGGVGADRIAVGQADLANQQGLAAGQTYANLYGQAQSAAQAQQQAQLGAGNALQGLGTNVLNAQLTGAQAQLGTGGLQQQLQQAQLNAPYQQQLAQAAFPYQQAQFGAGIAGALAPGLGGTTTGQGQTTSQYNPSLFGQIAGGIGAIAGPLGYMFANRGGAVNFSRGGPANPFAFASGGSPYSLPSGVDDQPINVDAMNIIPQENLSMSHPNTPSLNLNAQAPPQQQQSGSGGKGSNSGGFGGLSANQLSGSGGQNFLGMSNASQDALQDFMEGGKRGGVMGYADGGSPYTQYDSSNDPYDYAQSGNPDTTPALFADRFPSYMSAGPSNAPVSALAGTGMTPQDAQNYPRGSEWNPYRDVPPEAMKAWRDDNPVPPDPNGAQNAIDASGNPSPSPAVATAPPGAAPTAGTGVPPPPQTADAAGATPTPGTPAPPQGKSFAGFLQSPWAALTVGGLEAMRTGSVAAGFEQTMKLAQGQREMSQKDTSIAQTAKRLDQEAQFHQDQFTKMTPYQQAEIGTKKAELDYKKQLLGEGTMSPQAVDLAVDRIKAGDPRALTNLGRGAQSGVNLTRIQNRLAERAQEEGWNGATLAQAQATFSSQAAAARNQAVRSSNIEQAVEEAKNTFPLALQASESVPRGTWVPLNQIKQAIASGHSDPALARFNAANQAVITAYSQAMSRTGVSTVHAQEAAEKLMSTATSPEAYKAVISQLEMEMEAAKSAPDTVRQRILDRIGQGATGAGQPASASGASVAPAGGGAAAAPAGGAAPSFTGRTATNPKTGAKLRETSDGKWVP